MECFDCRSGSVDMLVCFPREMVVSSWRMASQLRESLLKRWSEWSEKLDFIGMRGGPRRKSIACSWQTARAVTIALHPPSKPLYYLLSCRSFRKITYLWWNHQPTSLHRKAAWWWQITSVEMRVSFEGKTKPLGERVFAKELKHKHRLVGHNSPTRKKVAILFLSSLEYLLRVIILWQNWDRNMSQDEWCWFKATEREID